MKVALSGPYATWYSRSKIPHFRHGEEAYNVFVGIYVFDRNKLATFPDLKNTPCQMAESVEQLKILENGYRIRSYPTVKRSLPSIDTLKDYETATASEETAGQTQEAQAWEEAKDAHDARQERGDEAVVKNNINNLLDCTLRDGGYVNNWQFSDAFVHEYLTVMSPIVGVIEIGFVNVAEQYRSCPVGPYRTLSRENMRAMKELCDPRCLIAVMADVDAINLNVLIPKNSDVDIVRLAISSKNIGRAKELYGVLHAAGYTVCMNYMSSHAYTPAELVRHAADTPCATMYVVDTIGCMKTAQVAMYVAELRRHDIRVGVHLHNNLQRAAGTYDAVEQDCAYIDGTIMGMGRGCGNLPIELCNVDESAMIRILKLYHTHLKGVTRSWGYKPEYTMQAFAKCHPNYVSKMIDMGIDATYILDHVLKLKGVTHFSLSLLSDMF